MKIKAIEPIKHGGKRHEPGTVVEVADAVGKALIDSGDAEKAGGKASAPAGTGGDGGGAGAAGAGGNAGETGGQS